MDDVKRILVFSEAGGTGRFYHAHLGAKNQRQRIHYLLASGSKFTVATQGFGRTHRTMHTQPPSFSPLSTSMKAQNRLHPTLVRRHAYMGANTSGHRQKGGQHILL